MSEVMVIPYPGSLETRGFFGEHDRNPALFFLHTVDEIREWGINKRQELQPLFVSWRQGKMEIPEQIAQFFSQLKPDEKLTPALRFFAKRGSSGVPLGQIATIVRQATSENEVVGAVEAAVQLAESLPENLPEKETAIELAAQLKQGTQKEHARNKLKILERFSRTVGQGGEPKGPGKKKETKPEREKEKERITGTGRKKIIWAILAIGIICAPSEYLCKGAISGLKLAEFALKGESAIRLHGEEDYRDVLALGEQDSRLMSSLEASYVAGELQGKTILQKHEPQVIQGIEEKIAMAENTDDTGKMALAFTRGLTKALREKYFVNGKFTKQSDFKTTMKGLGYSDQEINEFLDKYKSFAGPRDLMPPDQGINGSKIYNKIITRQVAQGDLQQREITAQYRGKALRNTRRT